MNLEIDGRLVPAGIIESATIRSRHTDRELRRVEVRLVPETEEEHQQILDAIKRAKHTSLHSTDETGNPERSWKVVNHSYSYRDGEQGPEGFSHMLELEEHEVLHPSRLRVGHLAFQPYSYEEEFDDDALVIRAKVRVSESEYEALRQLMRDERYFQVTREGISDVSREMRFGRNLWSHSEREIKYELFLVDRAMDEREPLTLLQPEMPNMAKALSQEIELTEALLGLLVRKGAIDEREAAELRQQVQERWWSRREELYRVEDIDEGSVPP